jgi:prephenate dehydrogenase
MQNQGNGNMHFHKVTILGVGLIGASYALAMRKHGLCNEIAGHGRKEDNLIRAKEKGIIDSFDLDPSKACAGSDLVLFAVPVGSFVDLLTKIKGALEKNAIVSDAGSVKGRLVRDMEALMPEGVHFVGAHPIAGSDRSGIDSAGADLFKGAKCILTPTGKTGEEALAKITALWQTFGSVIKIMNPDEHDRIYAAVSHLPHLIAYEIMNTVADMDVSYLAFSGQGFKDSTRIASSAPELWRDICILNKDFILESIEIFKRNLDRASRYIRDSDAESIERDFRKARTLREGIGQN